MTHPYTTTTGCAARLKKSLCAIAALLVALFALPQQAQAQTNTVTIDGVTKTILSTEFRAGDGDNNAFSVYLYLSADKKEYVKIGGNKDLHATYDFISLNKKETAHAGQWYWGVTYQKGSPVFSTSGNPTINYVTFTKGDLRIFGDPRVSRKVCGISLYNGEVTDSRHGDGQKHTITIDYKYERTNPTAGNLTVGTVTDNSISLSWTHATDKTTSQANLFYKVEYKAKDASGWKMLNVGNTTSYYINGLKPSTQYQVDLCVYDESGNYVRYGEQTVTTKAETYPLKVCGVAVTSDNCNDLSVISGVSGTARYYPATRTLNLTNANITASTASVLEVERNTYSGERYTIELSGTNTLKTTSGHGLRFVSVDLDIKGTGNLTVTSGKAIGLCLAKGKTTISGGCDVAVKGLNGIHGWSTATLEVASSTLTAECTGTDEANGSIRSLKSLTLTDAAITTPAGAKYDSSLMGVALNGAIVKTKVVIAPQVKEAYVVENGSTLTFYYDANKATRTGTVYGINQKLEGKMRPAWAGYYENPNERTTKVVFDSSFKDYKPTSTEYWFSYCTKLETIEGIKNLNTEQVTDMSHMFSDCKALTSLDLSSFNTSNVTNMSGMFSFCSVLTSLDLSSFNTSNVTDMSYMFVNCQALASLNVSKFNTTKVTDMSKMFSYCTALTTLDVSTFNTSNVTDMNSMFYQCSALLTLDLNFNTSNVTNMSYMFSYCSVLPTIDVSNFNTSKVTDMSCMFYRCYALTTIYCNDDWKSDVVTKSESMFEYDTKLKGAVAYHQYKIDVSMANPTTGYFTKKGTGITEAYAVENGSTLTFYYDDNKATRTGTVYGINQKLEGKKLPAWAGYYENPNERTTKVVFDSSFKDYKPTTTAFWFSYCTKLKTIEGMKNLNTEQVTDMSYMFSGCETLTSLDLSNFNTAKVTDMIRMFSGCEALTSLDLSNFNTAKVTEMSYMFTGCEALTSLDLSNFNTEKVTDMSFMFISCKALTSLDVSRFNTSNVTNMAHMFHSCSGLTTLDLSNFNTSKVTDMSSMFYCCFSLTTLDLSNFNTSNVTKMELMFYFCTSLTTIDLSNFNTAKVNNMIYMFNSCSDLTTIYCNDDWKSDVVKQSSGMFGDCTKLKGAVAYDESKTDISMANPTTGYFTKKGSSGIETPTADVPAARRGIYTLNGVRLNTSPDNLPAGIYVIDGRKVVKR